MKIFDDFIYWLDKKLKLNRLLSGVLGLLFILTGFYLTRNIKTHTVNNTLFDWVILTVFAIIGVLLLTLASVNNENKNDKQVKD